MLGRICLRSGMYNLGHAWAMDPGGAWAVHPQAHIQAPRPSDRLLAEAAEGTQSEAIGLGVVTGEGELDTCRRRTKYACARGKA